MSKETKSEPSWPPLQRPRRLRRLPWMRRIVAETHLAAADLTWPVFVHDGQNVRTPIASMPGVERLSLDLPTPAVARALGIPAVALFPVTPPALKTPDGDEATNPDNLACRAIRAIKRDVPEVGVICDVALDQYTSHGQDGLVRDGHVINDETVEVLCRQAVVQARAGCDIIAPSDMMDGRVGAIRRSLGAAGFVDVSILSYAAKYASAFYGPFRDAVGSASNLGSGDKKT